MSPLHSYTPRSASCIGAANVRKVLNGRGQTVQETHYYPYGMPFGESNAEALATTNGAALQPYKYGGKEAISMCDLSFYDFAARPYDPALIIFHTPDPMQEKYMGTFSHLYCLANPINYTDPSGMTVVADMESQKNIANTLTAYEEQFLSFDSDGLLDASRLQECENMSENMKSLTTLAMSEIQYNFITTDQVVPQDSSSDTTIDDSYLGLTQMPGAENDSSPEGIVNIRVKNNRPDVDQAKTTAHEAYGHAYVYEVTRDPVKATHIPGEPKVVGKYDKEYGVWGAVTTATDVNPLLKERIFQAEIDAMINYYIKH